MFLLQLSDNEMITHRWQQSDPTSQTSTGTLSDHSRVCLKTSKTKSRLNFRTNLNTAYKGKIVIFRSCGSSRFDDFLIIKVCIYKQKLYRHVCNVWRPRRRTCNDGGHPRYSTSGTVGAKYEHDDEQTLYKIGVRDIDALRRPHTKYHRNSRIG